MTSILDHGRPKEDQTTLTQQKLEPISDEEVEESSGESSSAPAYNRVEDAEASTSAAASAPGKQSQVEQVLNVAWDQALPEQKPASTSGLGGDGGGGGGGGRRQIFDVDYFLPTIGVCKEFLDELTLEEATTAAAGGEKSDVDALLKKQAAMKRIRLVNDVGSSYRRAMSARVDLKMRRQLCGLVAEVSCWVSGGLFGIPGAGFSVSWRRRAGQSLGTYGSGILGFQDVRFFWEPRVLGSQAWSREPRVLGTRVPRFWKPTVPRPKPVGG